MENWRRVWREGVAPLLSTCGLEALREALLRDDPELMQGATCEPHPDLAERGSPVQRGCLLAYPCWKADGLETVAELDEYFNRLCFETDQRLGEPGAVRWLIRPFDSQWSREEMIANLLPEVERELRRRKPDKPAHERLREMVLLDEERRKLRWEEDGLCATTTT